MTAFLLFILFIFIIVLWGGYRVLGPVWRLLSRMNQGSRPFGDAHGESAGGFSGGKKTPEDDEQTSIDLIHETNLDLDGGEYVEYEEVKEERK